MIESLHLDLVAEVAEGKEIIDHTKLFGILAKVCDPSGELFHVYSQSKTHTQMPKGGLLHAHLDATVNVDVLMRLVGQHSVYYVSVEETLTQENLSYNFPRFGIFPEGMKSEASLTDTTYTAGSWIPYRDARHNFAFGGPKGFDDWVRAGLTINPQEAYVKYNSSIKVPKPPFLSLLRQ